MVRLDLSYKLIDLKFKSKAPDKTFLCLKVVRNSFPFSIPTELYERLTRL